MERRARAPSFKKPRSRPCCFLPGRKIGWFRLSFLLFSLFFPIFEHFAGVGWERGSEKF